VKGTLSTSATSSAQGREITQANGDGFNLRFVRFPDDTLVETVRFRGEQFHQLARRKLKKLKATPEARFSDDTLVETVPFAVSNFTSLRGAGCRS